MKISLAGVFIRNNKARSFRSRLVDTIAYLRFWVRLGNESLSELWEAGLTAESESLALVFWLGGHDDVCLEAQLAELVPIAFYCHPLAKVEPLAEIIASRLREGVACHRSQLFDFARVI